MVDFVVYFYQSHAWVLLNMYYYYYQYYFFLEIQKIDLKLQDFSGKKIIPCKTKPNWFDVDIDVHRFMCKKDEMAHNTVQNWTKSCRINVHIHWLIFILSLIPPTICSVFASSIHHFLEWTVQRYIRNNFRKNGLSFTIYFCDHMISPLLCLGNSWI